MDLSPKQARAIAASGYVFLYPLVAGYKTMYDEAIDPSSPAFAGGFGHWTHHRHVASHESDVSVKYEMDLASSVWLDLRDEPWAFTRPRAGAMRSARVSDLWGFVLSDWAGEDGDDRPMLIAGDRWMGSVPPDVGPIVRAETAFVRCSTLVHSSDPGDLDDVRSIQRTYGVEPIGGPVDRTPAVAPGHGWWPATDDTLTTIDFWSVAAFALGLVTPNEDDRQIYARLDDLGVAAGSRWDSNAFSADVMHAIEEGMDDALSELVSASRHDLSPHAGRTRVDFDRDYFGRALAAIRDRGPFTNTVGRSAG